MKRSILALSSIGCTKHRQYTTDGTYYLDGTVITEDGNKWDYDTDTINGDGIAVVVRFNNKEYPCK